MGLSEASLTKPFSCFSHCKVSCCSPCCTNYVEKVTIALSTSMHTKTLIATAMKMNTNKYVPKQFTT